MISSLNLYRVSMPSIEVSTLKSADLRKSAERRFGDVLLA